MLAPLGYNLSIMVGVCTLLLLICWAYDTVGAQIEAGGSRPAESEFLVHPYPRRSRVRPPAPRLPKGWRSRSPRPQLWSRPSPLTSQFHPLPPVGRGHGALSRALAAVRDANPCR
jgi:hypothetical protein